MLRVKSLLVIIMAASVCAFAGIVAAQQSPSPWISLSDPTFTSVASLPDNVTPPSSNFDCDTITTRFMKSPNDTSQCVVQSPVGLASSGGIVFNGSSKMVPVVPPYPYSGLRPIPNQEMMYTYTNSPVIGLYLHFYKTVRDKMKNTADNVNGATEYVLTQGPEIHLQDTDSHPVSANIGAMAFSANGSWMVVDLPFQGFVRVNLATFEMTAFAPSMNRGVDYTAYGAQLTISNDGRYAAIRPRSQPEFKIYDINSCTSTTLPVDAQHPACQARDYWPFLSSQLLNLRAIYQPRFTNSNQLSVLAMYNYSPGSFKVSQFNLTAPGISPTGITYLGMGDSYASGQGAFNYILGTDTDNNTCHLSSLSYPYLLGADLFSDGHSVACSGAVMNDVIDSNNDYTGQVSDHIKKINRSDVEEILLNYLPGYLAQREFSDHYNPQIITLSIGGNDIGFADIVQRCISPKLGNNTCYATYEDQQELLTRIKAIGDKLKTTYRAVSAPGRKVYIIGYPQIILPYGNCANNVHLNSSEAQMFADLTTALNQTIQQAAASVGAQYVDVSNAFAGHRLCEASSDQVAVNGLTAGTDLGLGPVKFIGAETYHPNTLGHRLLEQAILAQTNNLKGVAPVVSVSAPSNFPNPLLPKTGRILNVTTYDSSLLPGVIKPMTPLPLQVSTATAALKTSSNYSVKLDAVQTSVGTITTDAAGYISSSITLPSDTACGEHTVHIYGQNIADQPIDIFKEVYVDTGTSDCEDASQPCGVIPALGKDLDADGIDDACDPQIGEPPHYDVHLTGSSIHIGR